MRWSWVGYGIVAFLLLLLWLDGTLVPFDPLGWRAGRIDLAYAQFILTCR